MAGIGSPLDADFPTVARSWSSEDFEAWLRKGALVFTAAPLDDAWTEAFAPLLLDFQKSPQDQLIANLQDLAEASQTAYLEAADAVGHFLRHLPLGIAPEIVDFFLSLAGVLRPHGFVEAVARHLKSLTVQDNIEAWREVTTTLVMAATSGASTEEFAWLVAELRDLGLWQPLHARFYILERLESRPAEWRSLQTSFRDDLEVIAVENRSARRNIDQAFRRAQERSRAAEPQPERQAARRRTERAARIEEGVRQEARILVQKGVALEEVEGFENPRLLEQYVADLATTKEYGRPEDSLEKLFGALESVFEKAEPARARYSKKFAAMCA